MSTVRYVWTTVVQTLFRFLPFPTRTGLVRLGRPGRDAPVLLTGNFGLTVARLRRSLRGQDAYLLVANSRGINVWCAATGGLFTNHDVVSVLKTSGIDRLVDHRNVILPQLAATGIEGPVVRRKTGWRVVWGPVHADDIPAYLEHDHTATPAMHTVRFPWPARLEMAIAWAFPISLLGALALLPFWRAGILPVAAIVWAFALALFLGFPLYERRLHRQRGGKQRGGKHRGFIFFDFGERAVPLVAWLLFMALLAAAAGLAGTLSAGLLLRWGIAGAIVVLILGLDLTGSTPTYKSGLHEDRLLAIRLDDDACTGAAFCEDVCPVRVFVVDHDRRKATLPGAANCVQCGACIVQCPFDALYFKSPSGAIIPPDTIRRYKLNLLGRRA
ncbi:MAG: 4Fe-4S dicluster domain-containing protein [Gemmatimonadota bacterium]|jgi:NAD-dependent dihydropyrimidine dehydrogenase PreA subunit